MLLSDIELKAEIASDRLIFEPQLASSAIQSASIDLVLHGVIWVPRADLTGLTADILQADPYAYMDRVESDYVELEQGGFVLGETGEAVSMPLTTVALTVPPA